MLLAGGGGGGPAGRKAGTGGRCSGGREVVRVGERLLSRSASPGAICQWLSCCPEALSDRYPYWVKSCLQEAVSKSVAFNCPQGPLCSLVVQHTEAAVRMPS